MENIKPSEVAHYLEEYYIIAVNTAEEVKAFLQIANQHGYVYPNTATLLSIMHTIPAFGFRVAYDRRYLTTCRLDHYLFRVLVRFVIDGITFRY